MKSTRGLIKEIRSLTLHDYRFSQEDGEYVRDAGMISGVELLDRCTLRVLEEAYYGVPAVRDLIERVYALADKADESGGSILFHFLAKYL